MPHVHFFSCPGFLVSQKMPHLNVFLYTIFGKQKECPSGFASIAPSGIVGAIAPSGIVGAAAIVATTSTFVGASAATASTVWIPRPTPPHCCESINLALQPSHLTCNSWTDPDLIYGLVPWSVTVDLFHANPMCSGYLLPIFIHSNLFTQTPHCWLPNLIATCWQDIIDSVTKNLNFVMDWPTGGVVNSMPRTFYRPQGPWRYGF